MAANKIRLALISSGIPFLLGLMSLTVRAQSYVVYTDGLPRLPVITSVLGEPRDYNCPNGTTGYVCRFHQGADLAGTGFSGAKPDEIDSIDAGIIKNVTTHRIDVQSYSGRIFHYIHVLPFSNLTINQPVSTGTPLGVIQCLGGLPNCPQSHLHLEEVDPTGTFDLNPQRPGALVFDDTQGINTPAFDVTPFGSTYPAVVPVTQNTVGPEDGSPGGNSQPLPGLNGAFVASGRTDFVAAARGNATQRKGVYNPALTIAAPGNPALIYDGRSNMSFDTVIDNDPYLGVQTVYYQTRNPASDNYIPTNIKVNDNSSLEALDTNDFDASTVPDGEYQACVSLASNSQRPRLRHDAGVRFPHHRPRAASGDARFAAWRD